MLEKGGHVVPRRRRIELGDRVDVVPANHDREHDRESDERLGEDPKAGALFVFSNRRHTRIKILCWEGTGLWLLSKRLEKGTFSWPKNLEPEKTKLKLSPQALAMLTDGVDLRGGKLRPWYEREE